jgi:hypothetical protein
MNRSFLIVGIPAVLTSFGWLWFVWGLKLASSITAVEVVLIVAVVAYVLRRQNQRATEGTGHPKLKSSAEEGH